MISKNKGAWHLEVTDTFSGEANYSWVDRATGSGSLTDRGVVRALKALMGITGQRAEVDNYGDDITIRPADKSHCIVGFATWQETLQD